MGHPFDLSNRDSLTLTPPVTLCFHAKRRVDYAPGLLNDGASYALCPGKFNLVELLSGPINPYLAGLEQVQNNDLLLRTQITGILNSQREKTLLP